ncbi:MAG: PilZ domain-containing protein, partial [Armatimonadota bacterium]|nr:PilZ domain-containing protein [Armatimonadota bacterium]
MAQRINEETLYLAEQRRYRRLEVSLPVWLADAEKLDQPNITPWSLGYTRDVSLGGSKIFVPRGEEATWRDVAGRGVACLLRFDIPGIEDEEYISGHIRHVGRDQETGNCYLGIEYQEGAERIKSQVIKA